jgi:methionine-R-sulfoxide reductase
MFRRNGNLASRLAVAAVSLVIASSCAGSRRGEGGESMLEGKADPSNVCFIQPTAELRAKLGPEAYSVLVESATEPPFRNAYWDNHERGVYVDAIDGTPLFGSGEKYDSGSGWPSFWAPLDPGRLVLVRDDSFGMSRIEVRAKASGGHLGHVFDDGPEPTGKRYCMNSASLRFVPVDRLAAEGYAELVRLFE